MLNCFSVHVGVRRRRKIHSVLVSVGSV